MANCVLCKRPYPMEPYKGLCSTCYQEYRAMMCLDQEPYRLAKLGDTQSLDLLGFLQFLKQRETEAYTPVWLNYARIRMLAKKRKLPAFTNREEWLTWRAESFPTPSHYARAVGHYLAYKGFGREHRIWFEVLMAGETPPQVVGVPDWLCSHLREYLTHIRTESGSQESTLDLHGRSLIHFFVWLRQNSAIRELVAVLPEHISAYLAAFKTDGMTQGRKMVPGHSKTEWTMAKRVGVLYSFFAWATGKRICLQNPVHGWQIDRRNRRTDPLPEEEVAHLVGVWTNPQTHPRAAMVGLMFLVYGLFPRQLLALNCTAVDLETNQFHGFKVPVPIPTVLRSVLIRYLTWRAARADSVKEQSLVISWKKGKYGRATPAVLVNDLRPYGVSPRQLRVTALAGTIKHGSLKLLSVFGLTADGMKRYRDLARLVDHTRKVTPKPNLW